MKSWSSSMLACGVALASALALSCGPSGTRTAAPSGPTSPPPPSGSAAFDPSKPAVLDDFETLAWQASASDGVVSRVGSSAGVSGKAMQLEFDLSGTSGYAVARRELPLDLSGNFELSFQIRGVGEPNNLEVKLIDESGENVWWYHRRDFALPLTWQRLAIKRRQVDFAWGPTADKTLRRIAAIEIVISSGKGGGWGLVFLDELAYRPLATPVGPPPRPIVTASASAPGHEAARIFDGDPATAWSSGPLANNEVALEIDLGRERDLGGIIARWGERWPAKSSVATSPDGQTWSLGGTLSGGFGGVVPLLLPDTSVRYLRIGLSDGSPDGRTPGLSYALAELELLEADEVETPTELLQAMAKRTPRGTFPRGFSGEQSYWTVVGVDGGEASGLLGEDGALELFPGGPSVEPFLVVGGEVTSWADVTATHSLDGGYLPIPSVRWKKDAWELEVTALASGDAQGAELAGRYVVRNRGKAPLLGQLVLAVRPMQVNPPAQFLNISGGVSPLEALAWFAEDSLLGFKAEENEAANGLRSLVTPDRVAVYGSAAVGPPLVIPPPRKDKPSMMASDKAGRMSAALVYELAIAPGDEQTVVVVSPLIAPVGGAAPERQVGAVPRGPDSAVVKRDAGAGARWFAAAQLAMRKIWSDKLLRVGLKVPPAGAAIVDTLRSSLAYMLISRDGPMLRPGTRSYARAWIRDGAMIGEALLRLGHPEVAAEFLRWYAPYQFASGKVPCCVDAHGAGPVPENDSHGQLMYLARLVYRYGKDRALAQQVWPNVLAAARYQEELRQSERGAKNQTPARRHLFGLLPPSISHEGYSAKPAYSYWDDFWGLRGLEDAAALAGELGDTAAAATLGKQRDELTAELRASIEATAAHHQIDFIAGAADLGDFDATSTTIAVAPGVSPAALPPKLLAATFERYWLEHEKRRKNEKAWSDYTPYELRAPGTFVRMGQKERAHALFDYFFADRRPAAWNQWAEVVGKEPRQVRFIGDMPHAWVHSDYARSALDLFAYERREDQAMVLAAGIPPAWLGKGGVALTKLPTPWGALSYSLAETPAGLVLTLTAEGAPPGGFALPWPYPLAEVAPADAVKAPAGATWRKPSSGLRGSAAPAAATAGDVVEAPPELVVNAARARIVIPMRRARR